MLTAADPVDWQPRRILIAGVSGVGKTMLAARLSERLESPHVEIDALFHGPGWSRRHEFEADVAALAAGPSWITEWQYSGARELLASRADTLVWLDLPFAVTLLRVIRRTIRRSATRERLWNGNVEPGLWHAVSSPEGIIRWAIRTQHAYRSRVPAAADRHAQLHVVRLKSQREIDRWLAGLAVAPTAGSSRSQSGG